jgi:hypothetical protein
VMRKDNQSIQSIGSSTLEVINNGTVDFTVVGNGHVGIGTTNPESRIHIKGDALTVEESSESRKTQIVPPSSGVDAKIRNKSTAAGFQFQNNPSADGSTFVDLMKIDGTGNIRVADQAGIITFNDTIAASGTTTVFKIDGGHGAMAFRINFVMNGAGGESVAKTYEVVKQFAKQPVQFKVIDTGPYTIGNPDMDVSFTQGATNYELVCTVTNTHSTQDIQIVTTMWLAGSPTDLNVTEF